MTGDNLMQDKPTLFNDLKLDSELTKLIFGFFSVSESGRALLTNKEFSGLSKDQIQALTAYFKNIKIYLNLEQGSLVANFSLKNVDLHSDEVFQSCLSVSVEETWDPVYQILGVNRDDLIQKLNTTLGKLFTVEINFEHGSVLPQIKFVPKNQNTVRNNALKLINKLTGLGMDVDQGEMLRETLEQEADSSTDYFKDIKIYLDLQYGQLVANFSLKNIDLHSKEVFQSCASFYDEETWDPVYQIIGINRNDLIQKLNATLGRLFTVGISPCQASVFPQISFTPKNENTVRNNSIDLFKKLITLGIDVEPSEILRETINKETDNSADYLKDTKIYLDLQYGQLVANFSLKNINLHSDEVFQSCVSVNDEDTWDPIYQIIGINRNDLIEKLNAALDGLFTVEISPCQGSIFPQISFTPKNENTVLKNSLDLVEKLIALGVDVEPGEILRETIEGEKEWNHTVNNSM